jgi:nucleotide-binding universal stress UspA family protein
MARRAHPDGVSQQRSVGRVVVGVDGSPASLRALHWAAAEAARRGTGLDVVHAWKWPQSLLPTEVFREPSAVEARGRELLHRAVESLAPREHVPFDVRSILVEEQAAAALVQAASTAELLVVGSRGRGGFSGLLLGSVGQHCTHHAPCPVAVIPPAWTGGDHGPVVVGVDGSDESYGALHWAIAEAGLRQADLHVVNAYDYIEVVTPIGLVPGVDRSTMEHASRTLLEQRVASALGAANHPPQDVALIPSPANATQALLHAAVAAELLVVGSRGRGGFSGLLLGSVSQQCAHHAPCPVVIVRMVSEHDRQPESQRTEQ